VRVKIAIPEAHVSKPVLDAALESVTRLNEQMLASGEVPSFERMLHYGVKWRPEPPGDEHFDSADRVIKRGWGDCDDLAPAHAASLRHSGEDPGAVAVVRRSGPKRWHAVVQRSDGSIDDPSKRAGMAAGVTPGVIGAAVPLMLPPLASAVVGAYILRPQIAMRPFYGQFQARADLPWNWREHMAMDTPNRSDIAMSTLHTAPVASTALTGAIDDVVQLASACGLGEGDHVDRLCAIADACEGASFDELAEVYGVDNAEAAAQVVGSLFGKIARGLGKVAKKAVMPIARSAASFVPGGSAALRAAEQGVRMFRGKDGKRRAVVVPSGSQPRTRGAPPVYGGSGRPGGSARNITFNFS